MFVDLDEVADRILSFKNDEGAGNHILDDGLGTQRDDQSTDTGSCHDAGKGGTETELIDDQTEGGEIDRITADAS